MIQGVRATVITNERTHWLSWAQDISKYNSFCLSLGALKFIFLKVSPWMRRTKRWGCLPNLLAPPSEMIQNLFIYRVSATPDNLIKFGKKSSLQLRNYRVTDEYSVWKQMVWGCDHWSTQLPGCCVTYSEWAHVVITNGPLSKATRRAKIHLNIDSCSCVWVFFVCFFCLFFCTKVKFGNTFHKNEKHFPVFYLSLLLALFFLKRFQVQ